MHKSSKIVLIILSITILGLVTYLVIRTRIQENKIRDLESDQLRLQKFLFEKYDESPEIVSKEINRLIKCYSQYPETIKSLKRAKDLYVQGHIEEAVRKLVVIIENKLKLKFEHDNDSWFLSLSERKKKYVGHKELFKRVKEKKYFDDLQLSIIQSAILIRHGESHSEGYEENDTKNQICMLGSIEAIGILVPKQEIKLINA